ncbi:NADH-quinone oxidoreductase subunit 5 family protein [Anianabacter salinae]|uniref:NADH-quinone oxidoreductase subunit 5 family protein n=1 Tax=Anianabacter salinae TaxID=2851023 RepID=UPI00225E4153|nr:proton-conducting transporter membrane subunit [Anianabacter salinae]MBV0912758.1 hypothetical protein [Anianabacter salinae]
MDNIFLALMFLPTMLAVAAIGASLFSGDRWLGWKQVQMVALAATGISALGGVGLFASRLATPQTATVRVMEWFQIGGQSVDIAFRLDPLSAMMAALVTVFGVLICRFSINYMHNEIGFSRYFLVYALFIVTMLMLVLADNLVLMFLGWEGVGLCSFLLIGHYTERTASARAATEAFVTNRLGDAAFILAIIILAIGAGTVRLSELPEALLSADPWVAPAAALGIAVAAMAKSGQFPLGGWMNRAMEGPGPTSTLFYGSIMVSAGVFLVVRLSPLFELAPAVLTILAVFGGLTAIIASLTSQAANDIKGALVNTSAMHLGMMFVICGLGAYEWAIFYIIAHAFYTGYQFLTAPSILHILHGRPDFSDKSVPDPVPANVGVALFFAAVMALTPPLLTMTGTEIGLTLRVAVTLGAAALATTLLFWMAAKAVRSAQTGHDDHSHEHVPARVRLGPAAKAAVTIVIAAMAGVLLQILPVEAGDAGFGEFLGLPQGNAALAVPALAPLLAFLLALAALHSVYSVLHVTRSSPEAGLSGNTLLRALHRAARNRFWVDAVLKSVLMASVLRFSERLARADHRLAQALPLLTERTANAAGDTIGWLDAAPRAAVESIPGIVGMQMAEAARHAETKATEGFEETLDRSSGLLGRSALAVERALGRPVVSVGVIILVALLALAGA